MNEARVFYLNGETRASEFAKAAMSRKVVQVGNVNISVNGNRLPDLVMRPAANPAATGKRKKRAKPMSPRWLRSSTKPKSAVSVAASIPARTLRQSIESALRLTKLCPLLLMTN
ncbi:MAG: hypothetical protein AABN34_18870 [Acidobacteriota bacterium]